MNSPVSSPNTKLQQQRHRPIAVVIDENENENDCTTTATAAAATSQEQSSTAASHPKRSLKVTFNECVDVRETIHVNDFTDEEYQLYWISPSEQDVILNMADITAELMTIGAIEDDEHICFRGLEGKTPEGNQEYSDMYLNLVEALIIEQEQCKTMTMIVFTTTTNRCR